MIVTCSSLLNKSCNTYIILIIDILITEYSQPQEMFGAKDTMVNTDNYSYADRIFESEIKSLVNSTDKYYANYQYRDVMTFGFFEMLRARDEYRKR
jgi:leucyl-tRNA synthetase